MVGLQGLVIRNLAERARALQNALFPIGSSGNCGKGVPFFIFNLIFRSPTLLPQPYYPTTSPRAAIAQRVAPHLSSLRGFHVPPGTRSLMTISTPLQSSHPSFTKMEDRKRSAGDELAPPSKRQAVNGKASADADMPWANDLENYQKDAIYRQMQEYKREKDTLQSQLKDVQRRALDHDDHLRVVDAWWTQLLDEVKLLVEDEVPSDEDIDTKFPTSLSFKGSEDFQTHLASRAKEIKSKLSHIFTNLTATRGQPSKDIQDFQAKLTKLLASQKEYVIKVDRLRSEKDELTERLETASLRYIKAEKKLDRAKSAAVAKLERQAIAGTSNAGGTGNLENGDIEMANGIKEESESSKTALEEAKVTIAKQKEQLDEISNENKSLTEQLTAASARLSNLNEDDYARTDLFKQLRSQHEDVIRRINHLEATNIQLREEAERYQAERTSYRVQVENESEMATGELESQLQKAETDLTRIRSARDELLADVSMRKASQDQERTSIDHMKELISAKDDRIASLEAEVERLQAQLNEQTILTPRPDLDQLDLEQLRRRYESMEQQFNAINKEMPALQAAWKKMQALGSKKVGDLSALEEKVQILQAEKSKADQKYFAARKDMDTRLGEVRTLKAQNAKSSEIITQLKDVETSNRSLLSNLEKQLTDIKQANTSIMTEHKKMDAISREATSKTETLKTQVLELTNMLKAKDANNSATKQRIHDTEIELAQLRVKYEEAQKDRDKWRAKSLSNSSSEEDMLRTLALCTICRSNFKDTVIRICGHTFCKGCVEDRLSNRMRKCPNCSQAFSANDVMAIHL